MVKYSEGGRRDAARGEVCARGFVAGTRSVVYALWAGVGPIIDRVLFAATFLFDRVDGPPFLVGPFFILPFIGPPRQRIVYILTASKIIALPKQNSCVNLTNLLCHSNSFTIMIKSCLPALWARLDAMREFFFCLTKKNE